MTITVRARRLLQRARARRIPRVTELEDAIRLVCREFDAVVVSTECRSEAA